MLTEAGGNGEAKCRQHHDHLGGDDEPAAVDPVGERPGVQHEEQDWQEAREVDGADPGVGVGKVLDVPEEGRGVDPGADIGEESS